MDVFKRAVTKTLPAYLQSLPLPDTVDGWKELTNNDWRTLAPFLAFLVTLLLLVLSPSLSPAKGKTPCVPRPCRRAQGRRGTGVSQGVSHAPATFSPAPRPATLLL